MRETKGKITVAKSAGFCFGVDRAIKLVYRLVDQGKKVCTLGPIIHNTQVVEDLQKKGVRILQEVAKAPQDSCVVIRSHGVGQDVYDQLQEKRQEYLDATCPFVAKIHTLVAQAGEKKVWIAGNPAHPEVIGIRSRCQGESFVFETLRELEVLLLNRPELCDSPGILVAQTTFHRKLWEKISNLAKKMCTKLAIFDTICYATYNRQSEASRLAQESDLMVVVGDKTSSNTDKLKKVCEEYTETVLIERAEDLDLSLLISRNKIGITAGASTPAYIIKEVHKVMNKMIGSSSEEMSFAELLEQSEQENQKIFPGKRIEGTVVSIAGEEVQVDIGGKQSGIIPFSEWSSNANDRPSEQVKVGDTLQLVVVKVSEQDGLVTLSKKLMDAQKDYETVIEAMEKELSLSGVVERAIKGGVLVQYKEIRVFIPLSQLALRRVEDPEEMVGQQVEFKVIEVNARQKRVVGSIRRALREVQKEQEKKLWETIEVGQRYVGTVRSMTNYGAFVDIGGVDGMVHISDLSWSKIKHPSEILKIGDCIEVYVKDLDPERHRISLGYKKMEENPWVLFEQAHQIGERIQGKVVSLPAFGAFVEIAPGIDGLIHISQISDQRVEKPSDLLKLGQEVEAEIVSMDPEAKRIGLSIRTILQKKKEQQEKEQLAAVEQIQGVHLVREGEDLHVDEPLMDEDSPEDQPIAQEDPQAAFEPKDVAEESKKEDQQEEESASKPAQEEKSPVKKSTTKKAASSSEQDDTEPVEKPVSEEKEPEEHSEEAEEESNQKEKKPVKKKAAPKKATKATTKKAVKKKEETPAEKTDEQPSEEE